MTEKLILGGLETSVEHAKELAWEYMNHYGQWSYPAYDSYQGNGDRNSVGPQDALAAGLLNAGQNPLTTQYSFLGLLNKIDPLLRNEHLTGTLDVAGADTLDTIAKLYGVLDGKVTPQLRRVKRSGLGRRRAARPACVDAGKPRSSGSDQGQRGQLPPPKQ